VRAAALTAAALCVPASLALGLALRACCTWPLSRRPGRTTPGLKATLLSWLPYALAFGAVPSIVTLALEEPALAPVVGVRGRARCWGSGRTCATRCPTWRRTSPPGVRGLPHALGPGRSGALAARCC
jgi:hypothetical protein